MKRMKCTAVRLRMPMVNIVEKVAVEAEIGNETVSSGRRYIRPLAATATGRKPGKKDDRTGGDDSEKKRAYG